MNFTLGNLQNVLRSIGRGVVFISDYWDGVADISLTWLGDTEGEITVTPTQEVVGLTATELTGSELHNAYVQGSDVTVQIPLWIADPALRATISPTGSASGGRSRRTPAAMKTMAIFPEELFWDTTTSDYEVLAYTTAGGWTVNGTALTAAQTALLGQSIWIWKGFFTSPPITYRHEEGGKAVETVSFRSIHDFTKPENHQVYTMGSPATATIVIDVP